MFSAKARATQYLSRKLLFVWTDVAGTVPTDARGAAHNHPPAPAPAPSCNQTVNPPPPPQKGRPGLALSCPYLTAVRRASSSHVEALERRRSARHPYFCISFRYPGFRCKISKPPPNCLILATAHPEGNDLDCFSSFFSSEGRLTGFACYSSLTRPRQLHFQGLPLVRSWRPS